MIHAFGHAHKGLTRTPITTAILAGLIGGPEPEGNIRLCRANQS